MAPDDADAERFAQLYREHFAAVTRFARRRADAATAEEVVAETFAVAWRRFGDVPDLALPWLFAAARRELSSRHRAAASDRHKTSRAAAELRPGPRDPADELAERDSVLRAFAALSEADREALRLVAWDGLSLADGARVAGTTRVAFAMRVSRARRRLATRLAAVEAPVPAHPRPMESHS